MIAKVLIAYTIGIAMGMYCVIDPHDMGELYRMGGLFLSGVLIGGASYVAVFRGDA